MLPAYPRSPFTRAEQVLGGAQDSSAALLPANTSDAPPPEEMEGEAHALLRLLWPRIHARFPRASRDDALAVLWTVVAVGGSLEELDEAFRLFDLIARYGDKISALEIREASRVLGDQADLFLDPWTRGYHQQLTGTHEFAIALWEHRTYLRLTEEEAMRVRQLSGLPEAPKPLVQEERSNATAADRTAEGPKIRR